MKHMENYVVMTKTELDAKVASQGEMTFGRKYDKGDVTFSNGEWYMSNEDGLGFLPPYPGWKRSFLNFPTQREIRILILMDNHILQQTLHLLMKHSRIRCTDFHK